MSQLLSQQDEIRDLLLDKKRLQIQIGFLKSDPKKIDQPSWAGGHSGYIDDESYQEKERSD